MSTAYVYVTDLHGVRWGPFRNELEADFFREYRGIYPTSVVHRETMACMKCVEDKHTRRAQIYRCGHCTRGWLCICPSCTTEPWQCPRCKESNIISSFP